MTHPLRYCIYKVLPFHFSQWFLGLGFYLQGLQIMSLHYHIFHCLILLFHSTKVLKNIEKTA